MFGRSCFLLFNLIIKNANPFVLFANFCIFIGMFATKLHFIFVRLKQVFTLFPLRAMRWLRHIIKLTPLLPKSKQQWWEQHRYHRFAWAWWSFEWALMTLELLGVFELYESIIVLKPSCRPINSRQRHSAAWSSR